MCIRDRVAQGSGGTLIDLPMLIAEAEAEEAGGTTSTSEAAAALLRVARCRGLMAPKIYMPVLESVLMSRPAPFVFSGFPRMASHVKQLEGMVGRLVLAVEAGDAFGAEEKLSAFLAARQTRVLTADCMAEDAIANDVEAVLDAMEDADVRFTRVPPPSPPASP